MNFELKRLSCGDKTVRAVFFIWVLCLRENIGLPHGFISDVCLIHGTLRAPYPTNFTPLKHIALPFALNSKSGLNRGSIAKKLSVRKNTESFSYLYQSSINVTTHSLI